MIAELQTADYEAILAPIAGDQPTGVDLREDVAPNSIYFRLRDARAQARDAERQADAQGTDDNLLALWRPVSTLAIDALKTASKDLEIATWLTEALVRIAGLRGLTAGASILGGLVEHHWDALFPAPDESDPEGRVMAVAGLSGQGADGTLMQPLRKSILFNRPDGSPFTVWQYQAALELASITDPARRAQRIDSGVLLFEEVEKEARLAGGAHWTKQLEVVTEALAAWQGMEKAFDEKAGQASPAANRVRELLEFISEACRRFAPVESEVAAEEPMVAEAGNGAAAASAPGAISGREQALRQLTEIAAWFKRNEPSSPIGFTLDEAVRRARLGWPELVAELVADETARYSLLTSAGIKPPTTEPQ